MPPWILTARGRVQLFSGESANLAELPSPGGGDALQRLTDNCRPASCRSSKEPSSFKDVEDPAGRLKRSILSRRLTRKTAAGVLVESRPVIALVGVDSADLHVQGMLAIRSQVESREIQRLYPWSSQNLKFSTSIFSDILNFELCCRI